MLFSLYTFKVHPIPCPRRANASPPPFYTAHHVNFGPDYNLPRRSCVRAFLLPYLQNEWRHRQSPGKRWYFEKLVTY